MAVVYGWAYGTFNTNIGWEKGAEAVYDYWENYWANVVDSYIFDAAGTSLTDADEKLEIQTLVNKMMFMMNLFLKGDDTEKPIQSGFYSIGFPEFSGSPLDNKGIGSGDFLMLNKYKRKYSSEFARSDNIRIGVDPARRSNVYF